VLEAQGNSLKYIASGTISTKASQTLPDRLKHVFDGLGEVMALYKPEVCAIEDSFVNRDPLSSLKLGQARGVAILAATNAGLKVFEYAPKTVKKAVTGNGNADKTQVAGMLKYLIPLATFKNMHESDALAIAICHAHMATIRIFSPCK
jgi:crossover junction endodeoxyribonuclease RuvC